MKATAIYQHLRSLVGHDTGSRSRNRNRTGTGTGIVAFAFASSVALGITAGCAGGGSRESFYALDDGSKIVASASPAVRTNAETAAARDSALPGIVVSAVTIPELVDRPQIVTRDASHRVTVSEQNLWAESVKSGIARTLATRLARSLNDAGHPTQVAAYPQSSIADPVLRVTVDVVRFDAVPNGEAIVEALWTVRRPADGMVRNGHTLASAPIAGTGFEAIVAGWNDAVATVDRDIAAMVVDIGVERPPPAPGGR